MGARLKVLGSCRRFSKDSSNACSPLICFVNATSGAPKVCRALSSSAGLGALTSRAPGPVDSSKSRYAFRLFIPPVEELEMLFSMFGL